MSSDYQIVSIEPSDALLTSMAIRYDHGLGVPGYYDDEMFKAMNHGLSHAQRMENTKRQMRQLHEEVVGTGFHNLPENGLTVIKTSDLEELIALASLAKAANLS